MSLHEYKASQEISAQDPPFYALIMACFRKADTHNLRKLQSAFPGKWREFLARYNVPEGLLEGEDDLEQPNKLEPLEDPEGQWEEELPEPIIGIPTKVVEARSHPPGILVLGSFNDYDHRKKET